MASIHSLLGCTTLLVGTVGACALGRGGLAEEFQPNPAGGGPPGTGGTTTATTTTTTSSTTTASTTSSGSGAMGGGGLGGQGGSAPWLAGYDRRKPIDFAPVGSPLSGFPAAVLLASDPELAAASLSDGRDLRFTADDAETILPHELELFEPSTGELVAWVRIPELGSTASTRIYLYYGDAAAAQPGPSSAVWDGTYASVWHLAQDPSAGQGAVRDSSANANHGTATLATTPLVLAPAMAGFGLVFAPTSGWVSFGDPVNGSLDFGQSSFSFSLWVLAEQSVGQYDMPWYKGGASAFDPGYDIELGNANWSGGVSGGNVYLSATFGNASSLTGSWQHLVAVVDRTTQQLRTYTNGVRVETVSISSVGSVDSVQQAVMNSAGHPMQGTIDEVRIARADLSADWIAAEHTNLDAPGTFFQLGAEELAP